MNIEQMRTTAVKAVCEACVVTRAVQNTLEERQTVTKSDKSPVTIADFAAQAVINHRLQSELGDSLIVGEESADLLREVEQTDLAAAVVDVVKTVWNDAKHDAVMTAIDQGNHDASAKAYWTLDPIDGTKGFIRRQQYAISLGFIVDGEVVLGVLGCPNLSADFSRPFADADTIGTVFYASKGQGTYAIPAHQPNANGLPVKPAPVAQDTRIRLCESVESAHSKQDATAQIVAALGGAGTPARLDSQCKYAVVARGQADAYLRMPTRADYVEKIWDHAAGMLVATEAGMQVTDISGKALDFSLGAELSTNRGIVCASPVFHNRLINAIQTLGFA